MYNEIKNEDSLNSTNSTIIDFPSLLSLRLIEDEDQMNQYIRNSNNANWTMKADAVQLAMANYKEYLKLKEAYEIEKKQNPASEPPDLLSLKYSINPGQSHSKKMIFLPKFSVPILDSTPPPPKHRNS